MVGESIGPAGVAAVVTFGILVLTVFVVGVATADHGAARACRRAVGELVTSDATLLILGLIVVIVVGLTFVRLAGIGTGSVEPLYEPEVIDIVSSAPAPSGTVSAAASPDAPRTYVVRRGDTLRLIAQRLYGTEAAWSEIYRVNRAQIGDPDELQVGIRLTIATD